MIAGVGLGAVTAAAPQEHIEPSTWTHHCCLFCTGGPPSDHVGNAQHPVHFPASSMAASRSVASGAASGISSRASTAGENATVTAKVKVAILSLLQDEEFTKAIAAAISPHLKDLGSGKKSRGRPSMVSSECAGHIAAARRELESLMDAKSVRLFAMLFVSFSS